MMEITHQNSHSFCRTCLAKFTENSPLKEEKYSIQENELEELLDLCTCMPVEEGITFPEFVCGICYEKLQSLQEFRCQAMQSLSTLNNIFKKLKEQKCTKDENIPDGGQRSRDIKLDRSEIKVKTEVNEDAAAYSNSRNNQEILQSSSKNEVTIDPMSTTPTSIIKSEYEEAQDAEIIIPDIKAETSDGIDALDCLSASRYAAHMQDADESSQSLDLSRSTTSTQNSIYATEYVKTNDVCPDVLFSNKHEKVVPSKFKYTKYKFQCHLCPRHTQNQEYLDAHLRTHQGLKPFECKVCGHSFNKADRYRSHVREAHATVALKYKCSYEGCNKVFTREGSYQMHYRRKHK